jgi:transcription elongation GreA/GreB family factor
MSPSQLDKSAVVAALRARIAADLEALVATQREAHAGATHEESRPENDKDTRAVEASYLARGLAARVSELELAAHRLASLVLRTFSDDDAIALGALVLVEDESGEHTYFMSPAGGGLSLAIEDVSVGVVTGQSPLGRVLLGARRDDDIELRTPRGTRQLTVLAVT